MKITRPDMMIAFCVTLAVCLPNFGWSGTVPSPERGYQLNDTSAEMNINSTHYEDMADQQGPPDSHEAMNNRDFARPREKRSFEFLVGLINNNSKYEVIRSDPELRNRNAGVSRHEEDAATRTLLDLLAKIVSYPEQWKQIHQVLQNLDKDLSSSQHIMRHQQQLHRDHLETKRQPQTSTVQVQETTTNKWPTFDYIEDNTVSSVKNNAKTAYQSKNLFAYHKVTGKPAHLKKNPTAYIAVSALSPQTSSESEDEYLLETELHQLKPWKNKQSANNL